MGSPAYWINPDGYDCRPFGVTHYLLVVPKKLFEFTLDPENPLTLRTAGGRWLVQPDRHFITDKGSIPMFAQLVLLAPHDLFEASYILHDSGYRHHGLWVSTSKQTPFHFATMTREHIDRICLIDGIGSEPAGNACRRNTIWFFVRAFGGSAWKSAFVNEQQARKLRHVNDL